ncbi:terminase family protein [Salmonella enterica]|nr:terminase family protein [Salmonella enterica]
MECFKQIRDLSVAELTDLIMSYPEDERPEIIKKIIDVDRYEKTHKLEYFKPFPYQEEFINDSGNYNYRFLMAANRIGKTFCGAAEVAMHLTGQYPDWFKGRKINGSGHVFWCIGPDLTMVREIQQKELIGTDDCRIKHEIGTGAIPRDCIELEQGWQSEGNLLLSARIKHKDGGTNSLFFKGGTDPSKLEGRKIAFAWIDEEGDYSDAIYGQCVARTANGIAEGQNGMIMITATPVHGNTPLTEKFQNANGKNLLWRNVTWDDCPMFTDKQREEMRAALPPWERDMRSKGIPFAGQGMVFKFSDDDLTVPDVYPLPHWQGIVSVDWGHVVDPTVIAVTVEDPDTQTQYLYDTICLDESEADRSPKRVAEILLNSPYRGLPVVVPHDSGLDSDASESNGKILQRYGVNVLPEPFRNPQPTQLKTTKYNTSNKSVRGIETGLQEMILMMDEGRYKVVESRCEGWLKEKRGYSYKYNQRTQKLDYAGADHFIDSSRYGSLSLLGHRGGFWADAGSVATYSEIENLPFTI